jgi:hypothetical protein
MTVVVVAVAVAEIAAAGVNTAAKRPFLFLINSAGPNGPAFFFCPYTERFIRREP